jgi:hypothetical protein
MTVVTSDGREPEIEHGHGPAPTDKRRPDGQHEAHWVLSDEERAKGFIRPVRRSYRHVGVRPRYRTRALTPEEQQRFAEHGYVAFEPYPESESPVTGRYWTEADLASGCGSVTSMPTPIAETYARAPGFYGSTFCCRCGEYLPVGAKGQFTWVDEHGRDTGERVGT